MRIHANTVWLLDLVVSLRTEMPCLLVLFFLTVLESLSVDVTCVKLADIYWNTSNPMFRIDNTDHIIDVNKNNVPYEYDQVNIICPVYPPGTHEDDAEKHIIYNVSKDEYDMCTITGLNPRVIAYCDKPHRRMYITITFRPFTPQPGGLEFRPGQDYYFISTSSKENFYNRIGGRCLTHNMRVIFKVCCSPTSKSSTQLTTSTTSASTANSLSSTLGPPRFSPPRAQPTTPSTLRPVISTPNRPAVIPAPTTPDFKVLVGPGSSADGMRPGKPTSGKKVPGSGENKDKHPNDTGMKIEELVRGAGSQHLLRHPWMLSCLLTLTTLAVTMLLAR